MLVLSRKLNERIAIDGPAVITIVYIDRNKVRLGVQAAPHVTVYREEIAPPGMLAQCQGATDASSQPTQD